MFSCITKDTFTSPYRLLPWAVFIYVVICWIVHPEGAIRTGMLADTDDYMRLNETINWLTGQGWFDLSHPRLSPGTNTVVHWSRLLDVPLALVMLPVVKTLGMANAALFASFIIPPATFGILLWLSIELAKPFVGPERANLATVLMLFTPLTMLNFVPGRVDHHGWGLIIAAFGLLSLERILTDDKKGHRYAVFSAIAFACGLWIGTEELPWVLMFIGCLALMVAWQGGMVTRRAALFGVAFAVANQIVLPLAVPPEEYKSLALSWYSAADLVLAVLVMAMFGGVYLCELAFARTRLVRFPLMVLFGALVAAACYAIIPGIEAGPFADYDDFDSTIALASIGEAQPLLHNFTINLHNHLQVVASLLNALQLIVLPILGLIASLFAARKARLQKRSLFLAHAAFLAVAIGGTIFWQMRLGWFMQFFAVAPLTWLLVAWWYDIATKHKDSRRKFALEAVAFALLGFVPVILIPSMAHDAPIMSDVVLFPAARPVTVCPLRTASDFLNQSWGYGKRIHTIISGANEGPELLYRTQHNVIAANFNVAGNEDVYNFFGARDDAEARKIAKHWHADLVLVCRSFPLSYARIDHPHIGQTAFLSPASDGKLHLVSNPAHPTLIERLVRGPIPKWLKPVEIPGDKDYLLFEVSP